MFLPQLQQSNEELARRLQAEGAAAVQIDAGLGGEQSDEEEKRSGGSDESGSEDEAEQAQARGKDQRVVQLQFAIGDFDGSAIAQLEEDDEEDEASGSAQQRRGGGEGKISEIVFRANGGDGEGDDSD